MAKGASHWTRGICYADGWAEAPPHFSFGLAKRETGRTRKGYAASVSGKAANGCAIARSKEKKRLGGSVCASADLLPPAGEGWQSLAAVRDGNALPLGKPPARGGLGYILLLFSLPLAGG